eukprot:173011_1
MTNNSLAKCLILYTMIWFNKSSTLQQKISGVGCANVFQEMVHLLLVGWNIYSDFAVLHEMKKTSKKYGSQVNAITSQETYYEYVFCHPYDIIPEWFNAQNESVLCECSSFEYNCDEFINDTIPSNDISCETEILCKDQSCQQILYINKWTCVQCECNSTDISIYSPKSLPVKRLYYEYNVMTDLGSGYEYCDPYSIINSKLKGENHLESLIKTSIAFLVVGCIIWLISIILRLGLLFNDSMVDNLNKHVQYMKGTKKDMKEYDHTNEHEAKMFLFLGRMLIGFIANLFHDVPHQIILLGYVRFLYSDYGYVCFNEFLTYPMLYGTTFNSNEDLLVILAKNWKILNSTIAWISLVVFNAGWCTYQVFNEFQSATRAGAETLLKDAQTQDSTAKSFGLVCCFYFILFILFIFYIFSHWTWPAFVAYYYIAPALHKTWTVSIVIFWSGIWTWGIIGLVLIVLIFYCLYVCIDKIRDEC